MPRSPVSQHEAAVVRPASSGQIPLPSGPRSRVEHAQPLIPSWVLALIAALALGVVMGHSHGQKHPVAAGDRVQAHAVPGPCGSQWQVERHGATGYTLRTIAAFAPNTPPPCAVSIAAGFSSVQVHAAGDAAILSTNEATTIAPIPASGWYAIPVAPGGDLLVVQPEVHGGDLTLTVVIPGR